MGAGIPETEAEPEAVTEAETETETGTETEAGTEAEAGTETEAVTEAVTEIVTNTAAKRAGQRAAPRTRALVLGVLLASASPALAAPADIVGRTADNLATGEPGSWDFSGTDITFKQARGEVWIADAFATPPGINAFTVADLSHPPRSIPIRLPAEFEGSPILGIADVPHGVFRGLNLVLIDPAFGTGLAPRPHFGFLDDDGNPAGGTAFTPIDGLESDVQLSAIDINPERQEIVSYDVAHHALRFIDFTFTAVGQPVPLLGLSNFFGSGPWFFGRGVLLGAGMGVAYDGPDGVLAGAGFVNAFETRFVLRYDLRPAGAYGGQAVDLSLAGSVPPGRDLAFIGLDTAPGGESGGVLLAHNFGDDVLYAFRLERGNQSEPVGDLTCGLEPQTGAYLLQWQPPASRVDSIHIFENGVQVAALGPGAASFSSGRALLGKAFLEVATASGGEQSLLRAFCQVENTERPPLPRVDAYAVQIDNLGPLAGVAVTPLPATVDDFRGYAVGFDSNSVSVFNHNLEVLETLQPTPPIYALGDNLAAMGVALLELGGEDHLAILDPDGPGGSALPSAGIYALAGPDRGRLVRQIDPIDLSNLEPRPDLFDWDAGADNNLVAGGRLPDGRFVLVRILFDGAAMAATQMVPLPQELLGAPGGRGPTGVGVSVLPSGNLLVAGSDDSSSTYTEAILVTPFCDGAAASCRAGATRFAGYAGGLFATNQFFAVAGSTLGPSVVLGLDTAYFAGVDGGGADDRNGVGVTYLPTGDTIILRNRTLPQGMPNALRFGASNLLIHGTNDCSHPDLVAAELLEETYSIPARGEARSPLLAPEFAADVDTTDYYIYAVNASPAAAVEIDLEVLLDGLAGAPPAPPALLVPPGRYYRQAFLHSTASTLAITVRNGGDAAADIKLLVGAKAIRRKSAAGGARFRRGDCDTDGAVGLTDAVVGLNWLFLAGTEPPCLDACDTSDTGRLGITDMVVLLNYLFLGGPAPAPPGPQLCGLDPAPGDRYALCSYPAASCR